jgi:precorrin-8X/cobalt-precorrin-8 methylmutase
MQRAWPELTAAASTVGQSMPVVLVGSAPTALEQLMDQVEKGAAAPSLVIGMPVGFVGVPESKRRLAVTELAQIRLEGTRGGAGLVAAAANALLRAAQAAS